MALRKRLQLVDPDDRKVDQTLAAALALPVLAERGQIVFTRLSHDVRNLLGKRARAQDHEAAPAAHSLACNSALISRRRILPVAVRGTSSTKKSVFGTLNDASRSRQ